MKPTPLILNNSPKVVLSFRIWKLLLWLNFKFVQCQLLLRYRLLDRNQSPLDRLERLSINRLQESDLLQASFFICREWPFRQCLWNQRHRNLFLQLPERAGLRYWIYKAKRPAPIIGIRESTNSLHLWTHHPGIFHPICDQHESFLWICHSRSSDRWNLCIWYHYRELYECSDLLFPIHQFRHCLQLWQCLGEQLLHLPVHGQLNRNFGVQPVPDCRWKSPIGIRLHTIQWRLHQLYLRGRPAYWLLCVERANNGRRVHLIL